jgi:hypothetical protein
MEKAEKLKSALASALAYLEEQSSIIIGVAGGLLSIIGFLSIPPFSFSLEAAIEVFMGGALMILAFLIHSRSYFSATGIDKAYTLSIISFITLLTIGIILYSFAKMEIVFVGYTAILTGTYAHVAIGKFPTYTLIANHIYQQFAIYAFGFAIVLAAFAVYLRLKID